MSQDRPTVPANAGEMSLTERLRLYGGIAIIVVLITFFLQNLHEAELRFLWFEWETRVIWALLLSAILGAISTLSVMTIRGRAARRRAQSGPG